MIGSLLPPVLPGDSLIAEGGGKNETPPVREAVSTPLAHHDDGRDGDERGLAIGRHDFVHAARHMIGDALKTFAHDLRDSFHALGFKSDMVMRLAHDVMTAAKQALKSGADFSANLMMAAVSQTTVTGAEGSASSFEMVASGIEITINHSTGSVDVNATQVEIQANVATGAGAPMPQIVDFLDTENLAGGDPGSLLASGDLDEILASEQQDGEAEALGPVLESLPGDAAPVEESGSAEVTETAAAQEADAEAGATQDDGEAVPVPSFAGVSHIVIKAFERYLDAAGEDFTYIKLDAVVPLNPPAPSDTVTDQVVESVFEQQPAPTEVPIAEQVIEEPVGQIATTDLVA